MSNKLMNSYTGYNGIEAK